MHIVLGGGGCLLLAYACTPIHSNALQLFKALRNEVHFNACSITSDYVSNLSNEQLKKETKVETRNDTLSGLIQTLKMILHRAPQDK